MRTLPIPPEKRLVVVLGASLSLNVLFGIAALWPTSDSSDSHAADAADAAESPANAPVRRVAPAARPAPQTPEAADAPAHAVVDVPAATQAAVATPLPTATRSSLDGATITRASLVTSIPHTLRDAAAPYGDNVSATLSRVLVWDLDLRRDLRPGDGIEAMWTLGTSDVVVIQAARYASQKFNRTISAYRFHATGDTYPSYWSADGVEIPHRLRNSPLAEYEQVTSLLRDRPTHHGMDFKVDVGTPIVTPFDGVVTRVNWNWASNGNCVEIQHSDGVLAKYLHLAENRVEAGARVRAGTVIALSGNTGRSTGPHLHYQLNRGTQVVDPLEYHGTERRTLPASDRAAFDAVVSAANQRFDAEHVLAAHTR